MAYIILNGIIFVIHTPIDNKVFNLKSLMNDIKKTRYLFFPIHHTYTFLTCLLHLSNTRNSSVS